MQSRKPKAVTVANILSNPKCNYLRVIGGSDYCNVPVWFVHYIENPEYLDSIQKHSLIITAGLQRRDIDELRYIVETLHRRECAGIICYEAREGGLPHEELLCRLAEQFKIAIIAMPHAVPLSQITETVTAEIVQRKNTKKSLESFLFSLINGDIKVSDELIVNAYLNGRLRKGGFVCAVIKFDLLHDRMDYDDYRSDISTLIEQESNKFKFNVFSLVAYGEIIMLIPQDQDQDSDAVNGFVSDFISEMQKHSLSGKVAFDISPQQNCLIRCREAFSLARKIAELAFFLNKKSFSAQEKGFYSMLLEAGDVRVLRGYCDSVLRPLIEYDKKNNTKLLDTLFSFVEEDFNTEATSMALFIHQNTLRYRLDKIQEILRIRLRHPASVRHLSNAVAISKYLEFLLISKEAPLNSE